MDIPRGNSGSIPGSVCVVEFLRAGPACLVVFQRMADSAFGKAVGLPGSVIQWQQGLRPAPVEIGDEARQRTLEQEV
jgi:hypothetical protein